MGIRMFAAIDVGSYMLNLKIYQFLPSHIMKVVDSVRYSIDLGTETFSIGKLSAHKVGELCTVLKDFTDIMKSYGVTRYVAYGTSAIRETTNTKILLDLIEQRTGIKISVLSNSSQRFLTYKSVAALGKDFEKTIANSSAILDIGGGSIQLSLFEKDRLYATQNMQLGVLRLYANLHYLSASHTKYEKLLDEMVTGQFDVFKKMYLKNGSLENLIVVDDYVSQFVQKNLVDGSTPGFISRKHFMDFYKEITGDSTAVIRKKYDLAETDFLKMLISVFLIKKSIEVLNAKIIWTPVATLCDGMAYEYGENHRLLKKSHNFEEDIIACAMNVSSRYMGSSKRAATLESITLSIFDCLKKKFGLSERDRLLLRLATILHDCGKYISLYNLGECSYNIISSTEIIGLTHTELVIVANVVKFNHMDFEEFQVLHSSQNINENDYLRISKLTAILRIANGLDRSHKEKFRNIQVDVKDKNLIITVHTDKDITLEKGLLKERANFFEEVFYLKPVIKQ